jgi:TetR/AcrR family transcriptional regulator, transcriptional repressor for nem operon
MTLSTRDRLIRRGVELFTEFGFNATGLERLLQRAQVTRGSFYHFFPGKQDYALEVIDAYQAYFEEHFTRILGDPLRSPLERLRLWMDEARRGMARHGFRRGCLVGNLSQELGPHDEVLGERLRAVLGHWEGWMTRLFEEGRAAGQLPACADPVRLARIFWIGWQGAILQSRLKGDGRPMEEFADFFLGAIVRPAPVTRRTA